MLELSSIFISSLISSVSLFYVIKKIIRSSLRILTVRAILLVTLYAITTTITYSEHFSMVKTLIFYLIIMIIYKLIFKMNLSKSFLVISLATLIFLISDACASKIILMFIEVKDFRGIWINTILGNITVGLLAYKIISINKVSDYLNQFVEKIGNKKIYDRVIFVFLMVVAWITIIQGLIIRNSFSVEYLINLISIIIFIVTCIIYIHEKIENEKMKDKYEGLLTCVKDFEDIIDKEQLTIHEYKNQLATLRFMTNENSKAKKYIDQIIGDLNQIENKYSFDMKNIPKGTIKGLIYYKVVNAETKNIDIYVNVSKTVYNYIKETNEPDLKSLSHLIGIYMDNAIEAASASIEKKITLELYTIEQTLKIVISNTYSGIIEKDKIKIKGFSTKGENRGKGLYFANKIIYQDQRLREKTEVTDKYYIQTLCFEKKDS